MTKLWLSNHGNMRLQVASRDQIFISRIFLYDRSYRHGGLAQSQKQKWPLFKGFKQIIDVLMGLRKKSLQIFPEWGRCARSTGRTAGGHSPDSGASGSQSWTWQEVTEAGHGNYYPQMCVCVHMCVRSKSAIFSILKLRILASVKHTNFLWAAFSGSR